MSLHPDDAALLEEYIDDRLSAADRAAFDERLGRDPELAAELARQRALDASLARTFRPPVGLGDRSLAPAVAPAVPRGVEGGGGAVGGPSEHPLRRSWGIVHGASLAAAAALVFLFLVVGDEPELESGVEVARTEGPTASSAAGEGERTGGLRPVPPIGAADVVGTDDLVGPDLELLFAEATASHGGMCSAPHELGDIEASLASHCGNELGLRADARGVFQGPMDSSEWPTGMVLTGYPDGPDGAPSVIVAECESQLACCLRLDLPSESRLQLFTWRMGRVLLTEITPRDEPRLLDYFEMP